MEIVNVKSINRCVTYRTTKMKDGTFSATVFSFDYQKPNVVHCEIKGAKNRAVATYHAKKATGYLRSLNKKV